MTPYTINYNHHGKQCFATIHAESFEDAEVRRARLLTGEIEQLVSDIPAAPHKTLWWLIKKAGWGGIMFILGCGYTGLIIGLDVADMVAL